MREDDAALEALGSLQLVVELAFWAAHWMSDRSRSAGRPAKYGLSQQIINYVAKVAQMNKRTKFVVH